MARGFYSVHPDQERRLREIGLKSSQVTQGYGYASASARSHEPVGVKDGRKFGWCIDLSKNAKPDAEAFKPNRENFEKLLAQGFIPFYRSGGSWVGNEHWHIVDVAWIQTDAGKVPRHRSVPRGQVVSFLKNPARNGLISNLALTGWKKPTKAHQAYIKQIFDTGRAPQPSSVPVKVCNIKTGKVIRTYSMAPGGDHIAEYGKLFVEETEA